MVENVITGKWDPESFFEERQSVLNTWPTGKEVDLDEAARYHASLAPAKNMVRALQEARKHNQVLVQPRAGIAPLEAYLELMRILQDEGGADILPTCTDSLTRHRQYELAAKAIQDSEKRGLSTLNGLPIVNYGVSKCRILTRELRVPLEVRIACDDPRLQAEMALASGMSGCLGGAIVHCLQYGRENTPDGVIKAHQYCHRLIAEYQDRGADIVVQTAGSMSTHMVPPSMAVAIICLEMLIVAEQGVKNILLGYQHSGHVLQDLAAIKVLRNVSARMISDHPGVTLWYDYHSWAGRFPEDEARAYGIIIQAAVAAAMAGVDMVMSKSVDQGISLPQAHLNAAAIRATKQVFGMMQHQRLEELPSIWAEEAEEIEAEVDLIIKRCLELGQGSSALGSARAIRSGVIDLPFTGGRATASRVVPVRDASGAIRYLDPGSIPITEAMMEYHRAKLRERLVGRGDLTYLDTIADAMAISKGTLVGKQELLAEKRF
ncbi:methylaspartate mutase subunit E [Chloroflexota bacterium]